MASKDSDQTLQDFILMKYDNLVMGRVIKSLGNAMFAVAYELKNKIKVEVAKLKGKFTSKKAKRVLRVDTNSFVLVSLDSFGKDKHEIYGVYERKDMEGLNLHQAILSVETDADKLINFRIEDIQDNYVISNEPEVDVDEL
jgi:translation initiation factor IF-1